MNNLLNRKNKIDGLLLLSKIPNSKIKTAFFDPQYRGVLDKLSYGNEGSSRGKSRCDLPQMSEEIIIDFIKEIDRVLINSGYLFLWIDKFHLCSGFNSWLYNTSFQVVDLIVWNKMKIGMGYRTRRTSEYLVVIQKKPTLAKSTWKLHNIPDVWNEKVAKNHPHSKPIGLQKELIKSVCQDGDIVLDPASGGYSVLTSCIDLGVDFIGGDLVYGENM